MNYTVEIQVTPTKGRKLTITQNVQIEYDAERKMYKANPDGVWTYGETAEGLAIRLLGVVVETAKVYKANGRRFLTKRAACRALAKQIINQRCECEPDHRWGDGSCDITPGITCWYHKDPERLEKIIRRMARIIMRVKTPNDKLSHGGDNEQ